MSKENSAARAITSFVLKDLVEDFTATGFPDGGLLSSGLEVLRDDLTAVLEKRIGNRLTYAPLTDAAQRRRMLDDAEMMMAASGENLAGALFAQRILLNPKIHQVFLSLPFDEKLFLLEKINLAAKTMEEGLTNQQRQGCIVGFRGDRNASKAMNNYNEQVLALQASIDGYERNLPRDRDMVVPLTSGKDFAVSSIAVFVKKDLNNDLTSLGFRSGEIAVAVEDFGEFYKDAFRAMLNPEASPVMTAESRTEAAGRIQAALADPCVSMLASRFLMLSRSDQYLAMFPRDEQLRLVDGLMQSATSLADSMTREQRDAFVAARSELDARNADRLNAKVNYVLAQVAPGPVVGGAHAAAAAAAAGPVGGAHADALSQSRASAAAGSGRVK